MVRDGENDEDELWLTLFDTQMAKLVEYRADYLEELSEEELRDTVLELAGTKVELSVRKTTWQGEGSYTVRTLKKYDDDDDADY